MSDQEAPEVVADEPLDPFADPAAVAPPLTQPRTGPTAETGEQRERRCPAHKTCVCSHTECRDGFLDEDVATPTEMNPHLTATVRCPRCRVRCPRCRDALEMRTELAGMKGQR